MDTARSSSTDKPKKAASSYQPDAEDLEALGQEVLIQAPTKEVPGRDPLDRFYTRPEIAGVLVDVVPGAGAYRRVLEPHVGAGAFARAVRRRFPDARLHGLDFDPEAPGRVDVHRFEAVDFLRWRPAGEWERPDWIVGNPPYAVAVAPVPCDRCNATGCKRCKKKGDKPAGLYQPRPIPVLERHLEHALDIVPIGGAVSFLLRLGTLAGRARARLWQDFPPRFTWPLSPRPPFVGEKSGKYEWAWIHIVKGYSGPREWAPLDWKLYLEGRPELAELEGTSEDSPTEALELELSKRPQVARELEG
jgi:hypothetical protein